MPTASESLQSLVHELAFVEWNDVDKDLRCTLGSLSPTNKQDTAVKMRVDYEETTNAASLYLTSTIRVQTARCNRRKNVFVVIPLAALKPASICIRKLSLAEIQSSDIARAIQEAGISESGFVICATFPLKKEPSINILMSSSTTRVKPCNSTASDLLRGLKSLSRTNTITIYAKSSSYAEVSLNNFKNRLPDLVQHPTVFKCSYSQRPVDHLDWAKVQWVGAGQQRAKSKEFSREKVPLPPPPAYSTHAATNVDIGVEVAMSPAFRDLEGSAQLCSQPNPDEFSVVPDTPAVTLRSISATPGPKIRGMFSPAPLNNKCAMDKSHDSYHLEPPDYLTPWLAKLRFWGVEPHDHPRLLPHLAALGHYVRHGDREAAKLERARCTALACFDPRADASDDEFGRGGTMLQSMAKLILWINQLQFLGDLDMFPQLRQLGEVARGVAAKNHGLSEFQMYMSRCEAHALVELGELDDKHKCAICDAEGRQSS